ncbi:MAG TPA: T9SS type A sorting domain-containing protein [Flavobacteriales bacterium]|nr:T9SS type A sorting domain-containing protein [Flavobacteriales bacterium]
MKYFEHILLMLLAAPAAMSQPTFQHFYQSAPSYSFNLIELPSHDILAQLGATQRVNGVGLIDFSRSFVADGIYRAETLRQIDANSFLFCTGLHASTCMWQPGMQIFPVVGRMDSLGFAHSILRYEMNLGLCYGTPGGLEALVNGGAIIWGRSKTFYALRTDSSLVSNWAIQVMHQGGFQFIKELPGGDLLAGINMDAAGAVVARMTADGDFIWSKSYMRPKGMVHDALIEPDGSIIVLGMTDSLNMSMFMTLPPWYQPKLFMMKLNGDGVVQWCKGWHNNTFRWFPHQPARIKRTLDGRYAVLATLGMPQNNLEFRPILIKTTVNGDTLWTSSTGQLGYIYLTQDLLPHSDGGYHFSGIIYGDLPDLNSGLPYIFKADSLGRFGCFQEHYPLEALDLFPADSSFSLNYIHGTATATPVYAQDSILDPSIFTTWNACTFATNVPNSLDRGRSMSIRPNPNTGRFTVQFTDPLMAESYYSVYDAMGKHLFQRPLPKGRDTEEVDLSRFGAGTYVIRFTDKEGSCYERVVVE